MLKNLLVGLLIIFAFVGGYLFSQKYNFKLENKTSEVSTTVTPTIQKNLIGGDLDEHGCKGSAGYSWCGIKQKCLRVWEEACEQAQDLKTIIKQLLVGIHGQTANNLVITVSKQTEDFARGGATEQGGGGMWLAAKQNGKWTIVWEGNGIPDCQFIKSFQFPSDMLTGICD
ncbi:MAG: hypothetical protein WC741_02110 [Patescibacteria group bacterium]|jgi:hypothetical protein